MKKSNNSLFIAGYCYKEIGRVPGIVTRKSADFRLTIPENQPISGYRYQEIATKKVYFVNISAKTKLFSKIFWGVTLGHSYY